jgi:xanthine/CO dehydrogenase XdhC/CoxF family maturation factor
VTEDIYSEIVKALEKKEKLALATLITRVGSAPRAVGAKYLIKADGTSVGSIGGGCVEAEVWQEAQKVGPEGTRHWFNLFCDPSCWTGQKTSIVVLWMQKLSCFGVSGSI